MISASDSEAPPGNAGEKPAGAWGDAALISMPGSNAAVLTSVLTLLLAESCAFSSGRLSREVSVFEEDSEVRFGLDSNAIRDQKTGETAAIIYVAQGYHGKTTEPNRAAGFNRPTIRKSNSLRLTINIESTEMEIGHASGVVQRVPYVSAVFA